MMEFLRLYCNDVTWFLTVNGVVVLYWYIKKRRREVEVARRLKNIV